MEIIIHKETGKAFAGIIALSGKIKARWTDWPPKDEGELVMIYPNGAADRAAVCQVEIATIHYLGV